MVFNSILLLVSFIIPVLCLFMWPVTTREILKDLRLLRILHYIALALLGSVLYFSGSRNLFTGLQQVLVFILLIAALLYAAVFAIVSNNIADLEADKISNTNRPLVKGTVQQHTYLIAGIFCLVYSALLSLLVHAAMFYCIILISTGYYIYSCRPFRLKRIPFIAKLLIGLNSLVITICGFVLAGGQVADFPLVWVIFIMLPLSLAANFVDLKDTTGDGQTGVQTLPVILGQTRAIQLIAFFTACTYIMAAAIIHILWVYPLCGLMASIHIALLYRKPYNEKPVFFIYISALFGLNIILLLNKYLL